MKAKDLRLEEIVDFSEGRFSLHGRRLVLHDLRAFAQFRKDLVKSVGPEHTRRCLTRFGYFMGEADAAAMKRIFHWDNLSELVRAGPRLHTIQGVAKAVVKEMVLDEAAGRLEMSLVWHDSAEAEGRVAEDGKADHPICWILMGYASGYASHCMGKPIYFIEQQCRAKGDRVCSATGKDEASWGRDLKPYLPYFTAGDIQAKIRTLTQELRRKTRELAAERQKLGALGGIKAPLVEVHSERFRRVLELASRIAPFDTSILITGETGTGKEVMARYIHRLSRRAPGPWVAINCAALPETLLESELFGHKAGAFTGALQDRLGLFEQAQAGTLFLDEIGDITPALQMKLLRALQEREIMRVGESKARKIDVRLIAATNRNLIQEVAEGRFREDLLYRLRVIEIEIPALRDRPEDILPLARYFVQKFSRQMKLPRLRLGAACIDLLQAYAWPGNIRELENAIERSAVLSRDDLILPEYLPPTVLYGSRPAAPAGGASRALAHVEADHIQTVLRQTGGNRSRAARTLGISPATLWRKLKVLPADAGAGL
jgi:two-component system, NtrC family, response regulator HydG